MHVVRVNNSIIRASLKLHKLSFHKLAPRCATLLSPNVVVLFFWLSEFPCVAERVVPIFNFKHIIKAIWVQHIYWFKYFQQNNTETSGQHGWGFSCWHEVFVRRFIISMNYTWSLFLFFFVFCFCFRFVIFSTKVPDHSANCFNCLHNNGHEEMLRYFEIRAKAFNCLAAFMQLILTCWLKGNLSWRKTHSIVTWGSGFQMMSSMHCDMIH